METKIWHNQEVSEVVSSLNSSGNGLSQAEAQRRLAQYGPNELREEKKVSIWSLVAEQFKSTLIIILLAAVVISVLIIKGSRPFFQRLTAHLERMLYHKKITAQGQYHRILLASAGLML